MKRRPAAPIIPPAAISRIDRRGIHAWRIHLKRRGRDYLTHVHDHQHGGSRQRARRAAERLLLLELKALPPPLRTSSRDVRNTTGEIGVSFESRPRDDGSAYEIFRAVWPDGRGGYVKRAYSIKRLGRRRALRMAVEARRQGLDRLANTLRAKLDAEIGRRTARANR